jgi:hypothetical protein
MFRPTPVRYERFELRNSPSASLWRHTDALDLTNGNIRMVQGLSRHVDPRTLMKYDDARRDDAGALAQMLGNDLAE